jgi:hypothetical protein
MLSASANSHPRRQSPGGPQAVCRLTLEVLSEHRDFGESRSNSRLMDAVISMAPDEQMLLIEESQPATGRSSIYADEAFVGIARGSRTGRTCFGTTLGPTKGPLNE